MQNINIFNFNDNQVRTSIQNNEVFFCLKDIAKILEIKSHRVLISRLNPHGVCKTDVIDNLGRIQKTTFINESNVYKVVFKSNKPEAIKFEEWVTSEVLPSIRKTGSYVQEQGCLNLFPESEIGVKYPFNWIFELTLVSSLYTEQVINELQKSINKLQDVKNKQQRIIDATENYRYTKVIECCK